MTQRAVIIALIINMLLMIVAYALGKSLATFTTSLIVWFVFAIIAYRRSSK